jgi:UDP-N-acetylmuramoylalanine--D-glutamate ligase
VIRARAFAGKKYAVLGLARSGAATVRSLVASGAQVLAWDDNQDLVRPLLRQVKEDGVERNRGRAEKLPTSLQFKNWMLAKDLTGFDAIIVSPGVPLNRHPVREKAERYGLPIIGDIELFARARPELPPHKVVGITGTNGKSTTTALIHHILATAGVPSVMGGNIGLPILSQNPLPEGGVYVLELSSYQIDLTQSLDCDVAVLLNITPDHLDRYESFEAYAGSKWRLFDMQSDQHFRLAGVDIATPSRWSAPVTPASAGTDYEVGNVVLEQHCFPALHGPHNLENLTYASIVCSVLGVDHNVIEQALRTYPGLPHRMERVREKDGVVFVNDSKATNPTATAPALAAFDRIRWICGGQAKTDNLDECAPSFGHVRKAYTIGEAGELFASLLSPHMSVAECETLERAVGAAAAEAEAGDTVLLSPACASFDQFRDFEDRGDTFKRLVGAL